MQKRSELYGCAMDNGLQCLHAVALWQAGLHAVTLWQAGGKSRFLPAGPGRGRAGLVDIAQIGD